MRRLTGLCGETLASRYLQRHNFALWKRNWRCKRGELDILAVKNRTLHIVEVKTRIRGAHRFTPLDQMSDHKRKKLEYLGRTLLRDEAVGLRRRRIRAVQIDFIGIELFFRGFLPRYTILHLLDIVPLERTRPHYGWHKEASYHYTH